MEPRDAYKYCPRCAGNLNPAKESLVCDKCGFHLYINPAPCNGAIILNDKDEILLVKRAFEPQKGMWDVAGGFINPDENIENSVKREIKEELSVEVEMKKIIGIYSDSYEYQNIRIPILSTIVNAEITGGELKPADDVAGFKFFAKDQIPWDKIAFEGIKKGLRDYLNLKD